MKWIGQNIYDFVATFRQGVTMDSTLTFDSVSLSAVQTSAESFADNDTSLMTSAAIDDTFGRATNAEMYHFIKEHLEFDQMIWEFGDDDNPDWVHVSYVSEEDNRNRCLKAYKNKGKTKYKVI